MEQTRILIIANRTAGGDALRKEVQRRAARGNCVFHLVVPATPPTDHALWTEAEAIQIARHRLDEALERFRATGVEIDGEVGDERPMDAIESAFVKQRFDEIILSTLPPGMSRWLKQDLAHRIERHYGVPLTTVIAEREPAAAR